MPSVGKIGLSSSFAQPMNLGQTTLELRAKDCLADRRDSSGPTTPADPFPASLFSSSSSKRLPLGFLLQEIWYGCRPQEWTGRAILRVFGAMVVVGLCSWGGIFLSHQSEGVATIWLSNGIIFGLLITQPPRRWLPYFVAGLVADTMADVLYGDSFSLAFGVSLANSVEVVTSALVLTCLFGTPFDLSRRRPLIGFLLVSVLGATALTSSLGATWMNFCFPATPWFATFRTWWLGDMLGMAVLAPTVIILQRPAAYSMLRPRELLRTTLVLLVPLVVVVLVFTHQTDPLIFFLMPALLLVAFRLGYPGTVLAIVLVTLLSIGFTVKGHGPLMLIAGPHMLLRRVVVAQVFAAVSIFTMFPVAALLEEKDALKTSLAASEVRYRELALSDELTGLANRRAFNLRMAEGWEAAMASQSSLGLLLLDADHFKQYNDVFGHLQGDNCLRLLAGVIAATLKGCGAMPARYGGEEFAVLLPGADVEGARQVAEAIRAAILAKQVPHPTGPSGIQTVSIGAAAMKPQPGATSNMLIKRADEALYCAKLGGRDRVAVLFSPVQLG